MKKSILSCLGSGYNEPIRDVLWGHIYLTPGLAALTKSGPFMRLHRIMQLGPAFYVYPGATHTRASHSIGVYHLARRLLICLAEQGADSWLSPEGVFSFLSASLLHDLGHFPYTHCLKELPLKSHEKLTAKIICSEPIKSLVKAAGGDPDFCAAIIDTSLPYKDQGELSFYRRLLSGTLDPDKLDYLNRDARYCGVPYGAQDVDFILSCLHPHTERGADINGRGIPSVESILFSKYLMYRTVYWHRQVRSATAMIKKAVLGALESGLLQPDELYNLDDQGFFSLMESRRSFSSNAPELLSLIQSVHDGQLYIPIAELSFNEKLHGKLQGIKNRSELEKSLALALAPVLGEIRKEKLIIDVPEPISFESDLYVADEGCFFPESSSTFKSGMVNTLVKSLRIIRVFVEASIIMGEKSPSDAKRILQITQKWLQL